MEGPGQYFMTAVAHSVVDGDTIRVRIDGEEVRVRILGINSPESGGYREEEDWGAEAKAYAKRRLEGKTVHLFVESGADSVDQYGRLLANVVTEDGENYSVQAVADGMATAYILPHNRFILSDELEAAEKAARVSRRGLWSGGPQD